ncbi:10 TM acyl transferase domain found in Cas1p-domain-containing protein [Dipodascopsis uninucleata]
MSFLANFKIFGTVLTSPEHMKRSTLIYACFVFIIALWRFASSDVYDQYKCRTLLTDGDWLDPLNEKGPSNWQPPDCIMHTYNPREAGTCLKDKHVLFIGDSTVRQLFWETVKTVDPSVSETAERHSDIKFVKDGLDIEFLWDPYLNMTGLKRIATCNKVKQESENAYLVAGGGLWFARYLGEKGVSSWKANIDQFMENIQNCNSVYRLPFFIPVTEPAWEKLDKSRSSTILKPEIDYMNSYIQWLSQNSNVVIPTAMNLMMDLSPYSTDDSGIHSQTSVSRVKANILLNMRCNQDVVAELGYPYDKTCCFAYTGPDFIQGFFLTVAILILPYLYIRSGYSSNGSSTSPVDMFISALFIFATVLTYCFVADRTSLFNKLNKQFLQSEFNILMIIMLVVGVLTLRRSDSEQGFMGRDQSDEWKGWMQLVILIYHITGASKILPIYKSIRVLVAAYLFMTGYGHTVFFYKKADFSLKRVANVLVRLNLLSCSLAYVMNTDYLFYYFAPLSSFWFLVVYFTMRIGSSRNNDMRFLLGKIALSAIVVHIFIAVPGILEVVWLLLERVFFISWNLREWRFRVLLDVYIVYVGMLGGLLLCKFNSLRFSSHPMWPKVRIACLALSVVFMIVYYTCSQIWSSKQVYNSHHPLLSILPILGFLFLRNATSTMRNTYSAAYAWIGTFSLETFTLQFHIWMAADTHGILAVIPSRYRVLNFIILTPLFLYVSCLTSDATGKLTSAIVSGLKKPAPKPSSKPTEVVTVPPPSEKSEKADETVVSVETKESVNADTEVAKPADNFEPSKEATPVEAGQPAVSSDFASRLLEAPIIVNLKEIFNDLPMKLTGILVMMWVMNVGHGFAK